MQRINKYIDRVIEWALILLMAGMVVNVTWQVFTRFILKDPSSFTEELARFLLIWTGLMGATYAVSKKIHLAINLLADSLTGYPKIATEIFINLCIFLFALFVMLIGGINLVEMSFTLNQVSAALEMKLGYVYLVLPLSGILIMYFSSITIYEHVIEIYEKRIKTE